MPEDVLDDTQVTPGEGDSPKTDTPATIAEEKPPEPPKRAPSSGKAANFASNKPAEPIPDNKKKLSEKLPDTPTPPNTRYYTGSNSASQAPSQALKWWRDVPSWAQSRMIGYVYRDWPILTTLNLTQKKDLRDKGFEVDDNYIDKLVEAPEHVTDLLDRYGAGDYHIVLSDTHGGRILCTIWVRENWRDFRANPPTDRRIDKIGNVAFEEKGNAVYIAYLRSLGKIEDPNQAKKQQENTSMAEATVTGILGKVVDKAFEDKPKDESSNTMVQGVVDMMGSAFRAVQEQMPKQTDPLEQTDKVLTLLQKLQPPKSEGDGDGGMVMTVVQLMLKNVESNNQLVLKNMETNNAMLQQMNEARINDMKARMDDLKELLLANRANPTAAPATPVNAATSAKEYVEEILSMAKALGLHRSGGGGVGDAAAPFDWKASLPDLMDSGAKLLQTIIGAWQMKAAMDARAANPNAPIVIQQPQVQAAPETQPTAPAAQEATQNGNGDAADLAQFLGFIEKPFINHFQNGWGGESFADWLIAGTDKLTYNQVCSNGVDTLAALLQNYGPIAQVVAGKELLLRQFIEDFMVDPDQRADSDEGDPGEVFEEQPTVIPFSGVPRTATPTAVVRPVRAKGTGTPDAS